MIPNHITIQELGSFLGTGLEVMTDDQIRPHKLAGVRDWEVYTESWFKCEYGLQEVKPIVRPLHQMYAKITHNGEEFTPIDRLGSYGADQLPTNAEIKSRKEAFMKSVILGRVHYNKIQRLISWHFDVFNWLHRTGIDGKPLALPMFINNWEDDND